jgi:hypothetical protein
MFDLRLRTIDRSLAQSSQLRFHTAQGLGRVKTLCHQERELGEAAMRAAFPV